MLVISFQGCVIACLSFGGSPDQETANIQALDIFTVARALTHRSCSSARPFHFLI